MAGKSKDKLNSLRCFPVYFEGGLQSSVRAELISQITKYILFERRQIPLSYEHLKRIIEQQVPSKPLWSSAQKERKKMLDVIDKVDHTLKGIKDAFEACPEIKFAAVVLGPTAVSPKEVYKIELPPLNPEVDNLPVKSCIKSLFREIVLSDPLGNIKEIHPTNAVVLLYASRDSNLPWFCPKPTYKLPVRGHRFHISLLSTYGGESHELTRELTSAELSGFEVLDTSQFDSPMRDAGTNLAMKSVSSESSDSSEFVCIDNDIEDTIDNSLKSDDGLSNCEEDGNLSSKTMSKHDSVSSILSQSSVILKSESFTNNSDMDTSEMDDEGRDEDFNYIWFQAPVIIKGLRHSAS